VFGRLALLLLATALASHVLALTLLFELRWLPPPPEVGAMAGPGGPRHPPWPLPAGLWLDIGVRLGAVALAAWWGARWLAAPLCRLADAAAALADGLTREPLPEQGPRECREATRGFNRMQASIGRQLADRDRLVAAVSHDLRTPLTRLRLRTETALAPAQRAGFCRDIAEMDTMISTTLDYLRGAADAEPISRVDPTALLVELADAQRLAGHGVPVRGAAAGVWAQPTALKRCLANLLENALRYGGSAELVLIDGADGLLVEVRDRGPGLPEAELLRVLAPFYRVEGSRNRQHGGVGLGLAIAHDIARQHGGRLMLANRAGGGLVARLSLPRGGTIQPSPPART
jgi:protein-histidine pros-kinase